ncbi:helix-turn-helix domain-containing protein [Chryseobacterium potabilaquae]|uniref:HTH cro/C1-type domain-containing protein n=1 Tax=Chryseobacterium potabilaquae TaxID=2675057 RepID=A0A6N4XDN3_9FLAO|nr:helix-turn-helix transcriptional regulator [Chryseobacterium potabilaquae]CAA7196711.1 hypothetical protein CHRY9293_02786 [Chryseobacterium potabilaquae]
MNKNRLQNVNELSGVSKRLLYVLEKKDVSGYKLEKDNSGIKQSQISHIKSGRNQPSPDVIDSFLKYFPEINKIWFLTGEGRMENNTTKIKGNNNLNNTGNIGGDILNDSNSQSNCLTESIKTLKKIIEEKEELLKAKDEIINSKDEIINSKDEIINLLKEQLKK